MSSVNHDLQVLSDRIILTPPVPGNAKGALWSEDAPSSTDWTAELDFRASGQETGSGNLQLWFTPDRDRIGVNSLYNVENFDGLALVVDQYGGRGGTIRGFLNDGTQNFRTHHSLESLAFGHCDFPYRNLGQFSRLKVQHGHSTGLSVSIDDRQCFSSNKISLPAGYYFGISATTGENPDSWELSKFVVSSGGGSVQPPVPQASSRTGTPQLEKLDRFPRAPEILPDAVPDDIKSQTDQFADLHNRLQSLTHQVFSVFSQFDALSQQIDQRQQELLQRMQTLQGSLETGLPPETVNTINRLSEKVDQIDRTVESLNRVLSGRDYQQNFLNLQRSLDSVQGRITDHLPETITQVMRASAPRMGLFVFVVVAVQVMLAGSYILYKRRRANMPKKFL